MSEPSREEPNDPDAFTLSLELISGLTAREVERRALVGYRAGDLGARVTAFYLADFAGRNMYQRLGYASLDQFARKRMRMAPSTLREYASVGRRLQELPIISRMFDEDALCWSQVRLLVRIVTEETQTAWGEWAQERTVNELKRQVKGREKGQLPTDPARRRIHTTTVAVQGRLNPVQEAVWALWREALEEQEFEGPISDTDMLMWMAHKGLRELSAEPFSIRPARLDLDPLNQDPPWPLEERDSPTGETLRDEAFQRDRGRCVGCSSKRKLSVHHIRWRCYGGRTVLENLVTLCEDCHSLVHDRFLILQGEISNLVFLDSEGRDLGERLPPLPVVIKGGYGSGADARASDSSGRTVTFNEVPSEVDADWWRRHRHLFTWREVAGGLEFQAGPALSADSTEETAVASVSPGAGLDDLIGQERVRRNLEVAIRSAQSRGEPLGHVLLAGPPGLGKTSLARAIASELGGAFQSAMAPVIRDPALLVRQLTSLQPGSVLLLDEVHRLPPRVAEVLYGALEEGQLDLPVRCGMEQRTLRVRLAPFTLVAATTQEDRLPEPLRGRFIHRQRLEFYGTQELGEIVARAAAEQNLAMTPVARDLIAQASRDTPREGLALLQTVCDEAQSTGSHEIDANTVKSALARAGVSLAGITAAECDYLNILAGARAPTGLSTLAARLGATRGTVQRVYEPFLLRRGLVKLTPRGRCLGEGWGELAISA